MSTDRQSITDAYIVAAKHAALDREYVRELAKRHLTCVVCGRSAKYKAWRSETAVCRFGGGRLERYHCPDCKALFGPAKMLDMTPGELSTEYAILYASYSEGDTGVDTIRTFRSMNPQPASRYLDWGCGWWSDAIARLRAEGWDVWGYEPTLGGPKEFVVPELGHIAPGLSGIYSNNVIEHLLDPITEFRTMRALLDVGAVMAHSSPCYSRLYLDTRFHVVFFLDESILELASRTGFEVVSREVDGEYMNTVFRAI